MTPAHPPRLHALVPCAGVGARANVGGPKQYTALAGRSVVAHTLAALGSVARLAEIVVVLNGDDSLFDKAAPDFGGTVLRCGGDTRARSVMNGLDDMAQRGVPPDDWVLVHDAARCLVRREWIDALIDACEGDEVGGLLALPLADTLKQEHAGRVVATLTRDHKWQAQTPQMFRLGVLRRALGHAGPLVTDEASAIEAMGMSPRLVPGSLENFKLTYAQDFALAERLLRTRERAQP
jgi:2-C-methyl-D-erythritol 4-phosphate cytidylyltransferase